MTIRRGIVIAVLAGICGFPAPLPSAASAEAPATGRIDSLESIPDARWQLEGFVGGRVRANVDHWLIPAPANNPGLLEMFARRDSGTPPDLVPWAGEFVGKYLISGAQAMRMSDSPELRPTLEQVVGRLLALQDADGYLGPWPKDQRLRGQWDLWGHYHIMLGLLLWHDETGDEKAEEAARRIADLVCSTCSGGDFRVIDAGSHEMNMSILHGLTILYRRTGEDRYLAMAREVLKDIERAGNYHRVGLEGREFFRSPRPRWESLHCLQGLAEMHRITGDPAFRQSFLHHWASIRRFDLRNTGGFSSGEQATGNPFVNDAIETCCVIAWQAVMIDVLALTGQSVIADDLERATLNAALGAQHPSGAWCTYNTPMAGQRTPSHIDISFQVRPGTPHLNCCSVNGPRGYGSISDWGLMRTADGLALNYYGPGTIRANLADGTPLAIRQQTDYPIGGRVVLSFDMAAARPFELALRIPAWSRTTRVRVNGEPVSAVMPGEYLKLARTWQPSDEIALDLDMQVRYEPGDREQFGKASFYRGPILLAADSRIEQQGSLTNVDELPVIDVNQIDKACLVEPQADSDAPWMTVEVPASGVTIRLIDFTSAGKTTLEGQPQSRYATWLPAANMRPPLPVAWLPADGAALGPGDILFAWRQPAHDDTARRHAVVIADSPAFDRELLRYGDAGGASLVLPADAATVLKPHTMYYWKIIARNEHGQAESIAPHKRFRIDPSAPASPTNWPYGQRKGDAMLVAATLAGNVEPSYGTLEDARGWKPAPGPNGATATAIELDGQSGMIRYRLSAFPDEDYTVAVRVCVSPVQSDRFGQIFSAWSRGMDDPLRVCLAGGKLAARIEAGRFFSTPTVPLEVGRWHHVAAVKNGDKLILYLDGQPAGAAAVPARISTATEVVGIGGNPLYTGGPEYLAGRFADLRLFARALTDDEVRKLAE
ncbi:MAG: glycoside hydrolase family 127 protein [Thermoguttaceae bacterium]|nr:glycoside hydrolase family 127 protein [Thermoguttaceae bacterium]